MFDIFNFVVLQGRYVKAAMDELPSFRPDEKTPAQAQALIDAANGSRTAFVNAEQTKNLATGELKESADSLHLACIQVYPIMKSRYRTDPGSLSAINKLPVDDRTIVDTIGRGESISILWGKLPFPPGSAAVFKAWDTMDKAAFDALLAVPQQLQNGVAGVGGISGIVQDYENAQGDLHVKIDALEDFVGNALIQGRAQFTVGTNAREVIDAIPTEPSQQPPDQAVISAATSPAGGQVHLAFDAPHATSFEILHKGPGGTPASPSSPPTSSPAPTTPPASPPAATSIKSSAATPAATARKAR